MAQSVERIKKRRIIMKLKELLKGREKLKEYDELSKWKDYFDRNVIVARGDGKPYEFIVEQLPDRIKEIITNALEAEIAKLDEK